MRGSHIQNKVAVIGTAVIGMAVVCQPVLLRKRSPRNDMHLLPERADRLQVEGGTCPAGLLRATNGCPELLLVACLPLLLFLGELIKCHPPNVLPPSTGRGSHLKEFGQKRQQGCLARAFSDHVLHMAQDLLESSCAAAAAGVDAAALVQVGPRGHASACLIKS